MTSVLGDLYVVDVTEGAQGPFAASLLADLGARVVKIERPGGELMRHGMGPTRNGIPLPLLSIARGRVASVEVDLKSARGREYVHDLVRDADIFIENWRPGAADRLGLGRQELASINPRIVYLSASGFGQTGPFAHLGSMDGIAAASGGLASVSGERNGRTERYRLALLDFVSAMVTGEMALAALLLSELTQSHVWAETSQLESAAAVSSTRLGGADGSTSGKLTGSSDPWAVPSLIVEGADHAYVAISAETPEQWQGLVSALGLEVQPEWESLEGRRQSREDIEAQVCRRARELDHVTLLRSLAANDVPSARVNRSMRETLDHPEITDDHVVWRRSAEAGWIAMADVPWRFVGEQIRAGRPCPSLGTEVDPNWRQTWGQKSDREGA